MKPRAISRFAALLPIAAPLALVFTASFAQAATRLWSGGNGNWTNGSAGGFNGTWANSSDNAVFSGSGGIVNITNAITTDATSPSISFTGNGYTLSAITTPRVVTLGAGAVNISVSENNTATIGNSVTVSRAGNFNIAGTTATAGTLVVDTGGALTSTTSYVLGTAGTNVTLRVNGGSVTSSGTAAVNIVLSNSATATSTMTLDSGVVSTATTTANNGLQFRTGTGTFNLNGGILTTLSVADTSAGNSTFNFNGGTLRASGANAGSYGLMSLVDVANVRNNGAIIDSNGFDVTVAQLLSHSAIDGDNAIDGGLEKKGLGALTLTNSNTFTGATKVSAGTLTLGNSLALQYSTLDTLNSVAGTASAGLKTTVTTLSFGGLTGNKDLSAVFRTDATGGPGGITALGGYSGVTALTLNSGTGVTSSYSGGIADGATGMTLTKAGNGTQTLSGTNTYTGATDVTAGRLNITGTLGNTLLTVSNNATLGGEGSTTGNVVFSNGSTLVFDPTTTGANQYFRTTGSINATAGGVKLQLSSPITSGTGIIIAEASSGWAGSTLANFTLLARGNTYFSGNQLLYDFAVGNLTWKGNAGSPTFWDVNTTQNWDNTGSADIFLGGDNVTFDNSAASKAVVVQAPITAGTLSFTNTSGNDYTLSGAALAATTLSKSGDGKVTVSNAVTLSGAATLSSGTLQLGNGTNATGSLSSAITNNAAVITDFGANDVTVANAISGGGSLTQAGTGIVSLTGNNSFGATIINSGATLQIGSGGTTGTLGSGAVTNNGTLVFNRSNNLSVSNAIGGSGALSKLAANTLTLSVANGYTGTTTIGGGSLIVTADGALGTNAAGTTVAAGASLVLSAGVNYATTEALSGSGAGVSSRGFIQGSGGNNTFGGNIELNANGVSRIGAQNGASLTLTGSITQATGITTASLLFRAGDTNGDFITLSNAGNSFGGDSQIFTNLAPSATNFAGVRLGITDALPTNRTITALSNTAGTSSLDLNGYDQTLNGLGATTGTGILKVVNLNTSTSSELTLTPTADKTTSTTITIIGGAGLGVINVVKDGASSQTLAGTHTYTGTTTVSAGTLFVTGALSSTAVTVEVNGTVGGTGTFGNGLTIDAGGALDLTGATLGLNSTGILNLTGGSLTLGALTFGDLVGWDASMADPGTYELINGAFTVDFGSTLYTNATNAFDFGNGKKGYFTAGSLNAVIIPEPSAALLGGLGMLALLRRRR